MIQQLASILVGISLLAVHPSFLVEARFTGRQNDAFRETGKYVQCYHDLGYRPNNKISYTVNLVLQLACRVTMRTHACILVTVPSSSVTMLL